MPLPSERSPRFNWKLLARIAFAGPIAVVLTFMIVAGAAVWMPAGTGKVDHIVFPLVLLPAVWAALFFHAILDRSLLRVALVFVALGAVHVVLLAPRLSG